MKKNYNRLLFSLVLLLTFVAGAKAQAQVYQDTYFVYSNADMMEITGLTDVGMAATELEIPATVTSVAINAFADAKTGQEPLTTITIKGNPTFASGAFGDAGLPALIEINMGSSMTIANIESLLASLKSGGALQTVNIDGWTGEWKNITSEVLTDVLTDAVHVVMPAEKVEKNQVLGNAQVYGYFEIPGELATFCGKADFEDADNGSNFLFYVPTEFRKETQDVLIERVDYVLAEQGVVMRKVINTARRVNLKRVDDVTASYPKNMLVGVTAPTSITPTDGEYTNMVLYTDGLFHPTLPGTIKANRAYLQVLTSDYEELMVAKLRMVFHDGGATEIEALERGQEEDAKSIGWYTLSGQRLPQRPSVAGLYINNGRVVMVK